MNRKSPIWLVAVLTFAVLICTTAWTTFTPSTAHAQNDFSCANVSEIPLVECEALVAIVDANPDFRLSADWLTTDTPCAWGDGDFVDVTCEDGHITELYLAQRRLSTLPPEIGNLISLSELNLWYNQLTMLPPEIGSLTSLLELDLTNNQLTTLPTEIGNLSSLSLLSLSDNQFAMLPPEISNLSSLSFSRRPSPIGQPVDDIATGNWHSLFSHKASPRTKRVYDAAVRNRQSLFSRMALSIGESIDDAAVGSQ